MKVLINASNLHSGGGVQVASSFINELSMLDKSIVKKFTIYVSSEVDKNINYSSKGYFLKYEVINTFGIKNFIKGNKILNGFDLVFTVFGPCYYRVNGINLVGFAQAWIIYPYNDSYKRQPLVEKIKLRIKFNIQKIFFKKSNACIVELDHVKDELVKNNIFKDENVFIVRNCVSNIYFNPALWSDLKIEETRSFKIGLISRDYIHKNTEILPIVKDILKEKYSKDVDFFVTFNDFEWMRKSKNFRSKIKNIGVLNVNQCPTFYKNIDAVIFPSLLECFSATPLEAMIMEKPLFASDRQFVKDICADFGFYFDPLDPYSIAKIISEYIESKNDIMLKNKLLLAKEYAKGFSNARQRALKYTEIIEKLLYKDFK